MRVFSFNKVIYDGYLSYDFFVFIIKQKFTRIFRMFNILPLLVLYILKRVSIKKVAEKFYEILLEDLTITELNLFKASNLYKIDLTGFGIVKDDPKDLIITSEPSFLIDLFINRNKYNVICTGYDLRERKIANNLCIEDVKIRILKANNINHIQQLYIYTFREKSLMKLADLIFIYRNHEVIEYDTYQPTLLDRMYYSIFNQTLIIYLGISLILLLASGILGTLLSIIIEPLQAWAISYLVWFVLSFFITLTYINQRNFRVDRLVTYFLGILPSALISLTTFLFFGEILNFYYWLVALIAVIFSFPLLVFVATFYKFE